ncbi:conserved Plasmodium protein, unknown function [Plasmodium ovale]|uniref:PH domain-containing protein n=2 Tax=Plasmodium ovale TaxID=36330 RepID=A0A1A8VWT0_PLAOA|nr:hypothetical protein POVCU2_0010150 [Plasmodium ovale curtisi]SBS83803.1 hypothetical protein POVCU1_009310 [Plasmodium ovale curtisi]SCP03827.1 conserved Plasmodium protein, unknown function [Plasmodium ovale]
MEEEYKYEHAEMQMYEQYMEDERKASDFYDTTMNINEDNINNFASINYSNIEKEFQMISKNPSKERTLHTKEFFGGLKNASKKKSDMNCSGSFSEGQINRKSIFRDECGGESANKFSDECLVNDNFADANSIEQILRKIQDDIVLTSTEAKSGSAAPPLSRATPPDRTTATNLDIDTSHRYNALIWCDGKSLTYSWESDMKKKDVRRCVHNFCINIVGEEFYLVRIEKLREEDLSKVRENTIETMEINKEIFYYKRCEEYDYENLGNIERGREYMIKRKNNIYDEVDSPLNFTEVVRAIEYVKEGGNLLKHTIFKIPHLRFFFLSKNMEFIKWFSAKKSEDDCKIYLADINSLEINNIDENLFENYKIHVLKKLSFCITYNNQKKKITLTCKCLQEFNYWVTAIRALMFYTRKLKTTKRILLSHILDSHEERNIHGKKKFNSNSSLIHTYSPNYTTYNEKVIKLCELKTFQENDKNDKKDTHESLRTFHLYKLISFPNYNVYQIKTKFYILRERFYKYKLLIEKEIDDYYVNEDLHRYCYKTVHPQKADEHYHEVTTHHTTTDKLNQIHSEFVNCTNVDRDSKGKNIARNNTHSRHSHFRRGKITTTTPNAYSLNAEEGLNMHMDKATLSTLCEVRCRMKCDSTTKLGEECAEEDSEEFKLQLLIRMFNKIDEKLKTVQKNILYIVKVLRREEDEEDKNERNFFSLENILKYTTDIYKNIENKISKNNNSLTSDSISTNALFQHIKKLHSQMFKQGELQQTSFRDSFPYKEKDIRCTDSDEKLIHIRDCVNEKMNALPGKTNNDTATCSRDNAIVTEPDSRRLIHAILFDMWLCEMELGNVEDIYTIYVYNVRKKNNFLANFEAPNFLKNVSKNLTTTLLGYINF